MSNNSFHFHVHQNVLDYQVLNTEMTWDVIFGAMESFKEKYTDIIEDYTVSKTTLEEVFLSFAKLQHTGDRTVKSSGLATIAKTVNNV